IATEMELGPEEEDSQEQSENHDGAAFCPHVPYRREIMGERLRGQGTGRGRRVNVNSASLVSQARQMLGDSFRATTAFAVESSGRSAPGPQTSRSLASNSRAEEESPAARADERRVGKESRSRWTG